jgi:transcriptional regulator with XRE-family HTH domain
MAANISNPTPAETFRNTEIARRRPEAGKTRSSTHLLAAKCADTRAMKTLDVLLEESGVPLDDLAARCGLERERVEAIADGRWLPSPAERQRIADALGAPVAEISWGHTMNPRNVRYHRFGLKEDFNREDG